MDRDELLDIERKGWDALCGVYQRVGGEWRLALYQQTPVAQG